MLQVFILLPFLLQSEVSNKMSGTSATVNAVTKGSNAADSPHSAAPASQPTPGKDDDVVVIAENNAGNRSAAPAEQSTGTETGGRTGQKRGRGNNNPPKVFKAARVPSEFFEKVAESEDAGTTVYLCVLCKEKNPGSLKEAEVRMSNSSRWNCQRHLLVSSSPPFYLWSVKSVFLFTQSLFVFK